MAFVLIDLDSLLLTLIRLLLLVVLGTGEDGVFGLIVFLDLRLLIVEQRQPTSVLRLAVTSHLDVILFDDELEMLRLLTGRRRRVVMVIVFADWTLDR